MKCTTQHTVFTFKQPSGTSRGVLTEKHAWFLTLSGDGRQGVGECSVIPGLSPDFESQEQYEEDLALFCEEIAAVPKEFWSKVDSLQEVKSKTQLYQNWITYPSILFGFETAFLDYTSGGKRIYFDNLFARREQAIPINGLIWMGNKEFILAQIEEKKAANFSCLKMKVGALDFEEELEILSLIRREFPKELILRVDANGAFTRENVRDRLQALQTFGLHSIEQPVKAGQLELMRSVIIENIVPVALDEELIGVHSIAEKTALLDQLQPPYIILKPSLHGGIIGSEEWISLAEERGINWWITSALESNIGLECIAQFTAQYPIDKHHGLGTGSLYVKNIDSDLVVEEGELLYRPS